ncbi:UNVERIFIED_CONTAM: Beta-carotene hydroxylase 2, chloroplastic [Sesamum radiatum]|uniref:beta-carotene 3-hydroxylase n=1 Tax=Sesamum radiatum TaxID=300843 RepID=A0AAW2NC22_SESRA
MAAGIYIATPSRTVVHLKHSPLLGPKPTSLAAPTLRLPHSLQKFQGIKRRKPNLTVCFVLEDEKLTRLGSRDLGEESGEESSNTRKEIATAVAVAAGVAEKVARKRSERFTYLVAAVMSSFGITSMSIMAVYYRFAWQMEVDYLFPFLNFLSLSLSLSLSLNCF